MAKWLRRYASVAGRKDCAAIRRFRPSSGARPTACREAAGRIDGAALPRRLDARISRSSARSFPSRRGRPSRPLSVSGCLNSWRMTDGGAVIDVRADLRRFQHVDRVADGGDQDLGREVVVVVDQPDVGDQLHAVEADVVVPADEGRDEARAGLGGEQRLVGREAERDVDHRAVAGQRLAGLEAVDRQRHLDADVVGDACGGSRPRASSRRGRVATTSAQTGPCDHRADLLRSLPGNRGPTCAISEGLVVTPSSRPVSARSAMSSISAVSTKNFM